MNIEDIRLLNCLSPCRITTDDNFSEMYQLRYVIKNEKIKSPFSGDFEMVSKAYLESNTLQIPLYKDSNISKKDIITKISNKILEINKEYINSKITDDLIFDINRSSSRVKCLTRRAFGNNIFTTYNTFNKLSRVLLMNKYGTVFNFNKTISIINDICHMGKIDNKNLYIINNPNLDNKLLCTYTGGMLNLNYTWDGGIFYTVNLESKKDGFFIDNDAFKYYCIINLIDE